MKMKKENIAQMKPINEFFKKKCMKLSAEAGNECEGIDPLLLPYPTQPRNNAVEGRSNNIGEVVEVIEILEEEAEVQLDSNQSQSLRSSSRNGSKPRPSYYINMDILSMDNVTRSTILKEKDTGFTVSTEKPKLTKKPASLKKRQGPVNAAAFFMTPKERLEQSQIERSLRMQAEMVETSKLSNRISQATGKNLNPFFNPRVHNSISDKSAIRMKTVDQPVINTICPFPNSSQIHVGWSLSSAIGSGLAEVDYVWKTKVKDADTVNIIDEEYAVKLEPLALDIVNLHDSVKHIKKDRLLELISEHYSIYRDQVPSMISWFMEEVNILDTPLINQNHTWTEICMPRSINSIVGAQNRKVCQSIVNWLNVWSKNPEKFKCFSRNSKSDKKRKRYDDFITSDEDSEAGFYSDCANDFDYHNTSVGNEPVMMVLGKSGKTAITHAAANIAGYHVLELNTATKRSGKILLDVLTSATTTHTVKAKKDILNGRTPIYSDQSHSSRGKTMILIDDADILFDEDKGFWASLLNVIHTTKCPILLTCTDNPLHEDNPLIQSGQRDLCASIQIGNLELPSFEEILLFCGLQAIKMGYFFTPDLLTRLIDRSLYLGPNLLKLQYYCSTILRSNERITGTWCWPISKCNATVPLDIGYLEKLKTLLLKSDIDIFTRNLESDEENLFQSRLANYFGPLVNCVECIECDYSEYKTRMNIYQNYETIHLVTNPLRTSMETFPFVAMMCKADLDRDLGIIKAGTKRTRRNAVSRHLDFMSQEEELLFISALD